MTWASTRLGVKCQIGRMARSLLSARMTASTSVSLDVLAPRVGRISLLQVGAQQIGSVATGSQAQFVAIPLPAQTQSLGC